MDVVTLRRLMVCVCTCLLTGVTAGITYRIAVVTRLVPFVVASCSTVIAWLVRQFPYFLLLAVALKLVSLAFSPSENTPTTQVVSKTHVVLTRIPIPCDGRHTRRRHPDPKH